MTSVRVPHSREDTKIVVKAAFEDMSAIKTYHDDGIRVIGKTGAHGLLVTSYGEQVTVEISEDQPSDTETMISVTGQKEVGVNIGANPEKFVSQFIEKINALKDHDIEVILGVLEDNDIDVDSKEVERQSQQASGSWLLIVILILIFVFMLFPLLAL